jgi:hypothetical protein
MNGMTRSLVCSAAWMDTIRERKNGGIDDECRPEVQI